MARRLSGTNKQAVVVSLRPEARKIRLRTCNSEVLDLHAQHASAHDRRQVRPLPAAPAVDLGWRLRPALTVIGPQRRSGKRTVASRGVEVLGSRSTKRGSGQAQVATKKV